MGVELSTPLVFSFSYAFRDQYQVSSAICAEFITSMSIVKGSVDIN